MALSIGLRPAHISTTNEHGEDYTVITKGVCATSAKGRFSLQGDSGSLVFDTPLRIVGMISSGNLTENVNYITPCRFRKRALHELGISYGILHGGLDSTAGEYDLLLRTDRE
jgi:hypothetical protein